MFECYFQNIKTKIIELLFEAKKSVKVISAFFTDKELFNLLCQLRKKGVTIELIIADEAVNFTSTGVHFEDFINIGGEFYLANRNDPKSLVHHKFCIVDGSTLITGSYNWTVRANHNKENIIITTNDNIVEKYDTEFEFVKDNLSTKYNKLNEFSIKTGFHDLDQLIFGLNSTELIFLHGLPGMGKTSLMLNLAMNICKDMDQTVGYITTDFSAEYLGPKILSLESMIQIDKILTGRVEDYESHTLQEISEKLNNYNFIVTNEKRGINELENTCRILYLKGAKIIIIDKIDPLLSRYGEEFENEKNRKILEKLKNLARTLRIPIIVVTEFNNRKLGSRSTERRPRLMDLGILHGYADIVLFLHRDDYFYIFEDSEGIPTKGKAEVIIAKNLRGKTGTVILKRDGVVGSFKDFKEDNSSSNFEIKLDFLKNIGEDEDIPF